MQLTLDSSKNGILSCLIYATMWLEAASAAAAAASMPHADALAESR